MALNRRRLAPCLAGGMALGGLLLVMTGCPTSQLGQPAPPAPTVTPGVMAAPDRAVGQTIFKSGLNGAMACEACHASSTMAGKTAAQINAAIQNMPAMTAFKSGATALTQDQVNALAAYLANPS